MNADQFNARYPVGTPVVAYPLTRDDEGLTTVTRKPAWTLGHGEPVVSVEGYAGGIALDHVDVAPRTNTPDVVTVGEDGFKHTTFKVKRACNGCGQHLGDVTEAEMDRAAAGLPSLDVRSECVHCAPLVELEAQGCRTWLLTPRSITRIDDEVDRDGIYAKGYFERDGDKTVCVGLRIGTGETRIVARYGDHVIRHPDGRWTVRPAPADTRTEAST